MAQYGTSISYRLGMTGIAGLIFFAAISDLLSLIPLVGTLVGPVFWISASAYLWTRGFGLVNARRLATSAVSMIAEMIPVVQEFPLILAGIVAVIVLSRIEDRTGISLSKKGVVNKDEAMQALNQSGRREPSRLVTDSERSNVERGAEQVRGMNLRPLNTDGVRQPTK